MRLIKYSIIDNKNPIFARDRFSFECKESQLLYKYEEENYVDRFSVTSYKRKN